MSNLQKMLDARIAKKNELVERSKKSEDVQELRFINEQVNDLVDEIAELREAVAAEAEKQDENQQDDTQKDDTATDTTATDDTATDDETDEEDKNVNKTDERTAMVNREGVENRSRTYVQGKGFAKRGGVDMNREAEKRAEQGNDLREMRSITVASSSIILPKHDADTINGTFQQVSNLVDVVNVLNLQGGESFTQPYEVTTAAGGYTEEGKPAVEAETTFASASIGKSKITAYAEITDEVVKLPAAPYADVVVEGIQRSIRKTLAKEIMLGDGEAGHLVGIFSDKATAIDASTDLSVATIDSSTLDNIIFSYGGDEAVEGQSVLILNKADLKAFSTVRTTDGKPFYDIKISGNGGSGTINAIPFIINSNCGAVTDAKTAAGAYCMAYGNMQNYLLAVFSQLDIQRSTDYKFREGMIAHKGVVYCGGNVVSHNGFVRVKKAAKA